jgi:hypothetical protein
MSGLAPARTAAADDDRRITTLTRELSTAGVVRVELRLPVGSVRVEPSPDDKVHVDLEVWCSTTVFGCEEEARELELRTSRDGNRLLVRVDGIRSMALGLTARGRVLVPKGKAVEVDLPVGELEVRGVTGDLDVDVGVGDVAIELREPDVRTVRLRVGIGEATLAVAGRHIEGSGWLGQKVRWGDGTGAARVAVNLGVGELGVKLN